MQFLNITEIRKCGNCGNDISHLSKKAVYCCGSCSKKAKRKQTYLEISCKLCGSSFNQTHAKQVYCNTCGGKKGTIQTVKRSKDVFDKLLDQEVKIKSVDGEAIKHGFYLREYINSKGEQITESLPASYYVMLQSDGVPALKAKCLTNKSLKISALKTIEILEWLTSEHFEYKYNDENGKTKKKAYTIIGYYLNYDFENWLRDVPDSDYLALIDGEIIEFQGYKISMIPRKMMHVWKEFDKVGDDGEVKTVKYKQRDILDTASYWARSFVKVLGANEDLTTPDEKAFIAKMKDKRDVFTIDDINIIEKYNQLECELLTKITNKLVTTMKTEFPKAEINIPVQGKDLYSPKSLANKFFKSIEWKKKHPFFVWKDEDQKQAFKQTFISDDIDYIHAKTKNGLDEDEELFLDYQNTDSKYDLTTLSKYGAKTLEFPFTAAFFGGRIESAQVGKWDKIYNYDINSAYPAAMAKLMEWEKDDMVFSDDSAIIKGVISERMAGMFLIEWNIKDPLAFYPFPYRNDSGNVFFPAQGKGWVSCVEIYSFLDSSRNTKNATIKFISCLFLEKTEGLGDIKYLTEGFNKTNKGWWKIYNARLEMNRIEFTHSITGEKSKKPLDDSGLWVKTKDKNPAEYGTKIVYNAAYGGTVQQVGVKNWSQKECWIHRTDKTQVFGKPSDVKNWKHVESPLKVFHDFTAMWITAYCRATIWAVIAPVVLLKDAKGKAIPPVIVAIQTDGIYSTIPLDAPVGEDKILGWWDASELYDFVNLQAGIYSYAKKPNLPMEGEHRQVKQRGWGRDFDFNKAYDIVKHGGDYSVNADSFIARGFAIHQKNTLKGCALQWVKIEKKFICNLASKRDSRSNIVLKEIDNKFFKPKENKTYWVISQPFKLKFDDLLVKSDKFKDEIYLQECMAGNEDFYAEMGE